VANITRVTAILERSNDPNVRQALRYVQRAWIRLDQQNRHLPSGRSAWARAEVRLTAEWQVAVLDLSVATTTTLTGVSSHLQEVTHDRPIIGRF
jgi:hypothetical protein